MTVLAQHLLHGFKKFTAHKRLMGAPVIFTVPDEIAIVYRVGQNLLDTAFGEFPPVLKRRTKIFNEMLENT
jgi:hypothetical protein